MAYIRRKLTYNGPFSLVNNSRQKGDLGEDIACGYLIKRGYKICERNFWKKWGEIDIIAIKDGFYHFFEVKSVTYNSLESLNSYKPEDNVHGLKRRHIGKVIETFFGDRCLGLDRAFEVHVITVYMNMETRRAKVKMIENVVI